MCVCSVCVCLCVCVCVYVCLLLSILFLGPVTLPPLPKLKPPIPIPQQGFLHPKWWNDMNVRVNRHVKRYEMLWKDMNWVFQEKVVKWSFSIFWVQGALHEMECEMHLWNEIIKNECVDFSWQFTSFHKSSFVKRYELAGYVKRYEMSHEKQNLFHFPAKSNFIPTFVSVFLCCDLWTWSWLHMTIAIAETQIQLST